jgi:plasmid maintenance system antidote protein VapI
MAITETLPRHTPHARLVKRLAELGMSAAKLGRLLDVPTNRIAGILSRQRGSTRDAALVLGDIFATPAEPWLKLPCEPRQARNKVAAGIRSLPRLRSSTTHG